MRVWRISRPEGATIPDWVLRSSVRSETLSSPLLYEYSSRSIRFRRDEAQADVSVSVSSVRIVSISSSSVELCWTLETSPEASSTVSDCDTLVTV